MMCAASDTVMATVEKKLQAALSPEKLMVTPTYGDPNGAHVTIEVVSDAFEGMMTVKRHQKVYKVIWEELQVRCLSGCHFKCKMTVANISSTSVLLRSRVLSTPWTS